MKTTRILCHLVWAIWLLSLPVQSQTRFAIPSYQDPGSPQWNAWAAPGSRSVGVMIVNVNNGDDTTNYPAVAEAIRKVRKQGIFVVGYVYTGYGQRDPAIVRNRVDAVFKNYQVDGIFFDEAPTDCLASNPYGATNYRYYQLIGEYVRTNQVGGRLVILNPGTQPANDCWMSIANIVVTAESSSLEDYRTNYVDQAWFHRYPPSRFWHIVYAATDKDQFKEIYELSHGRGAGWLYVTDLGGSNPYADAPSYWSIANAAVVNEGIQSPYATARPVSRDEAGNPVSKKVDFRWKATNGTHWQIFLATDQKTRRLVPASFGLSIAANKRIDVGADGEVSVFEYTGRRADGEWEETSESAAAFNLEPHTHLVEVDGRDLGTTLLYQIRSLDADGSRLTTSMPIPLSLSNTDFTFDLQNH